MAFLAWSQNLEWLFWGLILLLIITARSIGLTVIIILLVGAMWFLELRQYWFVFLVIIAGVVLALSGRKKGAGQEMYSPELMKLLGG